LHDTTKIEAFGIPAIAVATTVFREAARIQASALGRTDLDPIFVPHPIQDRTPAEIEAHADAVVSEIVARLSVGASSSSD